MKCKFNLLTTNESSFRFLADNSDKLLKQILEHTGLTFVALLIAILIAVPGGIYASKNRKIAPGIIGFTGILQTIPSIALLGSLIPLLGIGVKPAIVALFLYALLPILRNTFTGITEVPTSVIEAARGMGLTNSQILRKVEMPLALPIIFAGIRTATVITVGVATLASYIGAGGLGEFIFTGISLSNDTMILAGAIPAALLAIIFDQLIALIQRMPVNRMFKAVQVFTAVLLLLSLSLIVLHCYNNNSNSSNGSTTILKAGFDPEYYGRPDGYAALKELYDISFDPSIMNTALMYDAIKLGEVDVILGYATDGRNKDFDLITLKDDKSVFIPYYCSPIIRNEIAESNPVIVEALNLLSNKMSDSIMTELNFRVDIKKESPSDVAREFLESIGLSKPDLSKGGRKIVIGGKPFTEQYILAEIFAQIINGHTELDVDLRLGLGGTKVCFPALLDGGIDIYPEYTGTGFRVILSPTEEEIKTLSSDSKAIYDYVSDAFLKDYNVRWLKPLGFNNAYALMTPRTKALEMGWEKISDLSEKIQKNK